MFPRQRLAPFVGLLLLVAVGLRPVPPAAGAATQLYVGHWARLTARIPADWTVDPVGTYDYVGADGFVVSLPVAGQTLDAACTALVAEQRFGGTATVTRATSTDGRTCRVAGRIGGADATGVVTPHPHPFDLRGDWFAYAAVVASPEHLDAIAATVDFSPSRVTPDLYASSIVDLVMTRAYRADVVDWPAVRREVMTSIDGLPTVEMAREGLLEIVLQNLRLAGDNHSSVQLPERATALSQASGFGALVGGRRVLVVFPEGPADRAGVRAGDVLEAVDGRPFRPATSPVDPAGVIPFDSAAQQGSAAEWSVRRAGVSAAMVVAIKRGSYERYVPPTGRRLAGGIGYLTVPEFTTPDRNADYAVAGDRLVAAIDGSRTCGWVVDLRLNGGGSYSPMITAVGPILGNGVFLGWRNRDGRQTWV